MKKLRVLALFFCCIGCSFAQTNEPAPPVQLFAATELTLGLRQPRNDLGADGAMFASWARRTEADLPLISVTNGSTMGESAVTNSVREEFSAGFSTPAFESWFRRLDEGGYLTRPELPDDSLLARITDVGPAVYNVGKTKVSCSVLTAIKKKNPLCLLNVHFLNVSW